MNWNDAQRYIDWLNRMSGAKSYRLLSEAEIEYAARAGTSTHYPWGDKIGEGNANCDDCGSQWGNKQTAPVGSFKANSFGLYDMHGNVWQWVEDCWHENYTWAPRDGSARTTTPTCHQIVIRGGSWFNHQVSVRSNSRSMIFSVYRLRYLGFRVGRTLAP